MSEEATAAAPSEQQPHEHTAECGGPRTVTQEELDNELGREGTIEFLALKLVLTPEGEVRGGVEFHGDRLKGKLNRLRAATCYQASQRIAKFVQDRVDELGLIDDVTKGLIEMMSEKGEPSSDDKGNPSK